MCDPSEFKSEIPSLSTIVAKFKTLFPRSYWLFGGSAVITTQIQDNLRQIIEMIRSVLNIPRRVEGAIPFQEDRKILTQRRKAYDPPVPAGCICYSCTIRSKQTNEAQQTLAQMEYSRWRKLNARRWFLSSNNDVDRKDLQDPGALQSRPGV